jgi:16S rRNA (cytidine1402-2'-O)-methyltransferase
MLYIVSTPIGNLKDITLRALEILKNVDLIAAEDTRHTKILLNEYSINKPLTSYHSYNKIKKTEYLISLLKEGKKIALVSDSGTPGISDPGYHLINSAIQENIPITAIPGPTSLITALVLSGFPTHRFLFEGYLPKKSGQRIKRLKMLKNEERTVILFESPYRIVKLLEEINGVFGDIKVALLRELTKKFEEVRREKVSLLLDYFKMHRPKGEFIIVLNPSLSMIE